MRVPAGRSPGASAYGGRGSGYYASWADSLLNELRRGDPGALARLRAYVPRYAAATDASTAELRDARAICRSKQVLPHCSSAPTLCALHDAYHAATVFADTEDIETETIADTLPTIAVGLSRPVLCVTITWADDEVTTVYPP